MFGLKIIKSKRFYDELLKTNVLEAEVYECEKVIELNKNAVINLQKNNRALKNEIIELKNKNNILRSDVEGLEAKLIASQNDLAALSNEYKKLQEKYDFEHVENKMKIKGFDRGQYYQVLGYNDKANAFVRLGTQRLLNSLKGKIFNFDQLKDEILKKHLNINYLIIVRVDVKI